MSDRDKKPPLLSKNIYDSLMPAAIILLDDKAPDAPLISEAQRTIYVSNYKHEFKNFYLFLWEMNNINANGGQNLNDPSFNNYKNDIWNKYIHRTELIN